MVTGFVRDQGSNTELSDGLYRVIEWPGGMLAYFEPDLWNRMHPSTRQQFRVVQCCSTPEEASAIATGKQPTSVDVDGILID